MKRTKADGNGNRKTCQWRVLLASEHGLFSVSEPTVPNTFQKPFLVGVTTFMGAFAYAVQDAFGITGIGIGFNSDREACSAATEQVTKRHEESDLALDRDDPWCGALLNEAFAGKTLQLHLQATDFQLQVWNAVCNIPRGQTMSYAQLAQKTGRPGAARAVGNALAANPVAIVIPCHRVINTSGIIGAYKWGSLTKENLLKCEKAKTHAHSVRCIQ